MVNGGFEFWRTKLSVEAGVLTSASVTTQRKSSSKFSDAVESVFIPIPIMIPVAGIPIPGKINLGPISIREMEANFFGQADFNVKTDTISTFTLGAQYIKGQGLSRLHNQGNAESFNSDIIGKWNAAAEVILFSDVKIHVKWPEFKFAKRVELVKKFAKRINFNGRRKRKIVKSVIDYISGNKIYDLKGKLKSKVCSFQSLKDQLISLTSILLLGNYVMILNSVIQL